MRALNLSGRAGWPLTCAFALTLPANVRAAGASHALELPYVFGTMNTIPTFTADAGDEALSLSIQEYWARFAATGDPNGDGAVA